MKKIITITTIVIVTVLIVLIATNHNQPKPITHTIHKKPTPAQVQYGIDTPYTECSPNKPYTNQTKLQQAEIASTETEMAKYNDTPSNTENPELKRLNRLYEQEIAEYDTCTTVNQ